MKPNIFFRADGNQRIGLGHVYRSLALAEMLKTDFDCHFIIRNPIPSLQRAILKTCQSLIKLPATNNELHEARSQVLPLLRGKEIIVLDGYAFGTRYQQIVKENGSQLVCIDDIYSTHFVADLIINHAGGISPEVYSMEAYTQLCTGPSVALLRWPFCHAAQNRQSSTDESSCFVCLGGADPKNDTLRVLRKLEASKKIKQCYVITGAAYAYLPELMAYMERSSMKILNLSDLDGPAMVAVMNKCGMAVCPSSSISYEYLSVGGTLYLHQIADNQSQLFQYLTNERLAFSFERFPVKDSTMIAEARQLQAQVFRGDSPANLLQIFKNLLS